MKKEIVISGFGGQGGLAIGKNLAEAGMAEGLNVTWAPSYGPGCVAAPPTALWCSPTSPWDLPCSPIPPS